MSSGSYFPPSVKLVEINKKSGGVRKLGIPTVGDRVAQMVCKLYLEPMLESIFYDDSFGYRPNKSAVEAVGVARKRCWRFDWVVDLDIKGFFDNINHDLMMRAVKHHTDEKWAVLYIERWLKASVKLQNGTVQKRSKGTPQGGVISPLLANLFLHYAFDAWMKRKYPSLLFERYADDIVVHCQSEEQAHYIKDMIAKRLKECFLQIHPDKTHIVYCKDKGRDRKYESISFDFLGYTFRPRTCRDKYGRLLTSFLPAVSRASMKAMRQKLRDFKIRQWTDRDLRYLADVFNAKLRGWLNYYGRYYRSALYPLFYTFDCMLVKWVRNKYKKMRRSWISAYRWLGKIAMKQSGLFVHWELGLKPKV
jgi:RNA-directed DNA polymerase